MSFIQRAVAGNEGENEDKTQVDSLIDSFPQALNFSFSPLNRLLIGELQRNYGRLSRRHSFSSHLLVIRIYCRCYHDFNLLKIFFKTTPWAWHDDGARETCEKTFISPPSARSTLWLWARLERATPKALIGNWKLFKHDLNRFSLDQRQLLAPLKDFFYF